MFSEILFEASVMLLTVASVAILLFGLAVFVVPEKIESLVAPLNHWISTDAAVNRVNQTHNIERFFYRHHIPMGIAIVIGSIYTVYMFIIGVDGLTVLSGYQDMQQTWGSLDIFEALIYFLLLLNCLAIFFGLVVILRPSLLKKTENWSNNWVSIEQRLKPLDTSYDISSHWLPKHPRLFGLLVAMGSLYILTNLVR